MGIVFYKLFASSFFWIFRVSKPQNSKHWMYWKTIYEHNDEYAWRILMKIGTVGAFKDGQLRYEQITKKLKITILLQTSIGQSI